MEAVKAAWLGLQSMDKAVSNVEKDSEGFPSTGKEQISELLGLPADLGAAIVNAPASVIEGIQEWYTGKDADPLYRITNPYGGRQFFKDLLGVEGTEYKEIGRAHV